ncbi:hypothetical protein A4H97_10655 [Niastella yeongjuensis]|uniref:DUF5977 domain-containing protein n=1 Tax=Niastella yeongjuensis TaxID=354355 RepID=A0A1V9EFB7_9BACT|nr:DUF5977 domain-containing protein [Niastella yeongjuensis]OQP44813.1 hypothetical protein A4H97_10655 [Niastella yeongjuensis]SEP42243.1 YD repeat-containing protein [Niastella yeongjuensis]
MSYSHSRKGNVCPLLSKMLLLLWLLPAHYGLLAQSSFTNALAFPSANNSFSGKTATTQADANVDVDLYTGTAQVHIGICNLASKELTIPVSLNYTGGRGIKLQEYAGCAGIGWQLDAGGNISRVVRGFPDEQFNGYIGGGWGNKLAAWAGWSTGDLGSMSTDDAFALTGINTSTNAPTADGEPDLFYVKTPFFAFQFVLDGNGQPVVSNSNGINISYNSSANSFIVTDDQGNRYYFGSSSASVESTGTTLYGTARSFISTWYLDKIVTWNAKDLVTFTYMTYSGSDVSYRNDTLYHYQFTESVNSILQTTMDSTPQVSVVYNPKYISSITSALGKIEFSYAYDRQDDKHAARLTGITAKEYDPQLSSTISKIIQTYTFNTGYFGSPSADANILRLRLDDITVAGNTTATATPVTMAAFMYNQANILPSRKSGAFDYWGYCSATSTSVYYSNPSDYWTNVNRIREPNLVMAATDVLTSVSDLKGSTWKLTYELNDYRGAGTRKIGGLRVSKISRTVSGGDTLNTIYSYTDNSGSSTGQIFGTYYDQLGFYFSNASIFFSESPYVTSDLNGNFVGYSSVKVSQPNGGGYTISSFSNFNDPNLSDVVNQQMAGATNVFSFISTASLSYKRGLLNNQTMYTASGDTVTQIINTYASITPSAQKARGYRMLRIGAFVNNFGGWQTGFGIYYTNAEDYRLTQTIKKEYDQKTRSKFVQTTSAYTYSPANNRLIQSVTTTDSKGLSYIRTMYHADDISIPMVTTGSAEQQAISALSAANRKNVPVHLIENRNGVLHQLHHVYSATTYGTEARVYLANTDQYTGTTLTRQQFFKYDPSTSNLVSSRMAGGKTTAYLYGYNASLPVATAVNAENIYVASTSVGSQSGFILGSVTTGSFTATAAGNIVLTAAGSPQNTYTLSYTLSGAASRTGFLCATRTSAACSFPESVTLTNMPAGNYTISYFISDGNPAERGINYTYPVLNGVTTVTKGFFYEGFEDSPAPLTGSAHTGNGYYRSNPNSYVVNFPLPDSRNYILQYWNWANGKWVMNQQAYTGSATLPGIIDDVRIFPADGLLTTNTYNCLTGMTGETDPSGLSKTYEYDGFGRLNITRDQDKNIVSKLCYSYAGQPVSCPVGASYANTLQSSTYTRNNCGTGYMAGTATYTVGAGTYTSSISQADANQQAQNDIATNGQAYANTNGTCTLIYYNVAQSRNFTRNNCLPGYAGGTIAYTIAAGQYNSLVSQADADQKATNDINANGQNYANTNAACNTTQVRKFGDLNMSVSNSVTFTTTIVGNIVLTIDASPPSTYAISYSLSGPTSKSGNLCAARSTTPCSFPESVTITNAPAGTYTLTANMFSGSPTFKGINYTYYGAP